MLAVTAMRPSPSNPLSGLQVGEWPEPSPPPGWEVVEVRAAGLNHHDLWTLRGVGIDPERLPIVLGCEAAGVTADGREVVVYPVVPDATAPRGFSVLSEHLDGTHAERVAVPRDCLVPKPASLSFEEAACLPVAWLTAYRMLFVRSGLRPGQRVLVQGAGGGVSTALILLARTAGLHVTVTSRSPDKLAAALELGAHEAVEVGARLPQRVHGVMETVGEATWGHSLRSVVDGGVIVCAGATTGPAPSAELQHVFFRQLRIIGSTMGSREELSDLLALLDTTGVRPPIDTVLPLAEAREAYRRMAQGELFGKLVLTSGENHRHPRFDSERP